MPDAHVTVRDQYLEQMVESASQEGLLLMLVEGAVNFIRRAQVALERGKLENVHNCLVRAQNIYVELVVSLDMEAGEFAENLALVYQYLYNLLIEANMRKDKEKVSQALRLAEEIRDLWKDAVEKARLEGSSGEPGPSAPPSEIGGRSAPSAGVYEPAGGKKISKAAAPIEESSSRLNITG
jgi:flagellar protein FliS